MDIISTVDKILRSAFAGAQNVYEAREYILIIIFLFVTSWLVLVLVSMDAFGQPPTDGKQWHNEKSAKKLHFFPYKNNGWLR